MTHPASWVCIPVFANYGWLFDEAPPPNAAIRVVSEQPVVVDGVTIFPGSKDFPLDAEARVSFSLPASNDPSLSNRAWTYRITERMPGGRTFYITVPYDSLGIDLATVAPIGTAPGGDQVAPGPRGPAGQWTELTQAAYDALSPPDPNVLYVVIG